MQTSAMLEQVAGGMDQKWFPSTNKASFIENFRYDPSIGWKNDRGWEPLVPYAFSLSATEAPSITTLQDLHQPTRFLSVIQRHQGGEEYYLQERNGRLFYEFGDRGAATSRKIILDTGRNLTRPDDVGTQAIPYGRLTVILNGYNRLLKWWGREKVDQFGFYQLPPSPTPLPVDTNYDRGVTPPVGSATSNILTGIALQFEPSDRLGLGTPDPGSVNTYSYRVSYVTDTGSESPLSSAVTVGWTCPTGDDALAVANQKKYGVILTGLDPGPDGVVARRIYRTKNKEDGITGSGDVYYFLTQINENTTISYVDTAPDNQLVIQAPSATDSSLISTGYKYGAAWNGSMWLGGGESTPTKLVYSAQGLPEQFPSFNYFDVGVRDGGHITALYPYYDVLLVFRERAIDAVFANAAGNGYTCTTIRKDVGTTATNSIKLVPGFGVMFINKDGFWLIKGGLRGGSQLDIDNMSPDIEREMKRLSKNALQRVSAAYSEREKEYWCIYPVDGETECSRGAVFNIVNGQWALRGAPPGEQYAPWRFTQIATDQSGYFILGTRPIYNAAVPALSSSWPGLGLQVWSAREFWGDAISKVIVGQGVTYVTTPNPRGPATWQSTWYDMGDDSIKKRILTVELDVLTEGNNEVELQWASDYNYDWSSAGTVSVQRGDVKGTSSEQATYAPSVTTVVRGKPAIWGSTDWEDSRVTRLRWDVRTGLVDQFAFKIISSNQVQMVRFQINFTGGNVKTINTRMPGAS